MSSPTDLVDLAEAVLNGTVPVPGGRATRSAALIARQALEEVVDQNCAQLMPPTRRPSMKSKLVILRQLGPAGIGDAAQVAWSELSNACHHSAYELQPSPQHIRRIVETVRTIQVPQPESCNSNQLGDAEIWPPGQAVDAARTFTVGV